MSGDNLSVAVDGERMHEDRGPPIGLMSWDFHVAR
jgi:hypothetical protein